jgi:hypothetical protein
MTDLISGKMQTSMLEIPTRGVPLASRWNTNLTRPHSRSGIIWLRGLKFERFKQYQMNDSGNVFSSCIFVNCIYFHDG